MPVQGRQDLPIQGHVDLKLGAAAWPSWHPSARAGAASMLKFLEIAPKGTPTNFTFLNPDGGSTTVNGWSWELGLRGFLKKTPFGAAGMTVR